MKYRMVFLTVAVRIVRLAKHLPALGGHKYLFVNGQKVYKLASCPPTGLPLAFPAEKSYFINISHLHDLADARSQRELQKCFIVVLYYKCFISSC